MSTKREKNMIDNIFDIFIETSLENAVKKDLSYLESKLELESLEKMYRKLDLTEYTREIIEQYVDAIIYNDADYGRCAYKTGFKDCILLLKELGVIG